MIALRTAVYLDGLPGEVWGRQQGLECGRPFRRYDVRVAGKLFKGVTEDRLKEERAPAKPVRVSEAGASGDE